MLEKGQIYFFYTPKVMLEEVHELFDVQRLHIILKPEGSELKRMIDIAKKQLPEEKHKYWGFVATVSKHIKDIDKKLEPQIKETKTRGERTTEGARPVGEGVYGIIEHHGHTHLAYVLELPKDIGEVQEAFNIQKEDSLIITIKNPKNSNFAKDKQPQYPPSLIDKFEDYAWIRVITPKLLDYQGAELLFIGTGKDLVPDLSIAGKELKEQAARTKITETDLFSELRMRKETHPTDALEGNWK